MNIKSKLGFTLIELLVVMSILAILIIIAIGMFSGNRDKADDAKTKSELNRLKIAFEDYYADNNCYPPAEYFDETSDCGSEQLKPYLNQVPCDPRTNLPYVLEKDQSGCTWFKLYTNLKSSTSDPEAIALCDPTGSTLGNYVVSSANVTATVSCTNDPATSTPTPTPTPTPNPNALPNNGSIYYYCSAIGNCTNFDHTQFTCTPYYANNPNCDGGINKCSSIGSCVSIH